MKKITIQVSDKLYKQINVAARFMGWRKPTFARFCVEHFTDQFMEKFKAEIEKRTESE